MMALPNRPAYPSSELSHLRQNNAVSIRNDLQPSVGSYMPVELPRTYPSDHFTESFVSVASSSHPPKQIVDSGWRPVSFSNHKDHPFNKEDGLLRPSLSEAQRGMLGSQTDYGRRQPIPHTGVAPVQIQGSTPFSLALPSSFVIDHADPSPYISELGRSQTRNAHHGHEQPSFNLHRPMDGSFSTIFDTHASMHPSMQRYTENNFQKLSSDNSFPRFPVRELHNPYASTFEQTLKSTMVSGTEIRRYDSSFSADHVPIVGTGSMIRASPISSKVFVEQVLPRVGSYQPESSAEVIPNLQKQLVSKAESGAPYDPLFDSIEPSPGASKMRVEEQNSGVNDTGSASKFNSHRSVTGSKKHRGGLVAELKFDVEELGEVATDADAGGVENASPELLDGNNWSPAIPVDVAERNVGEIEIDQVRSPGKSKRNKDSKSMKLFKIAVAEFAKEVLKPSWRQGNMSKEAFKTIVKKTVDKVSRAVPSHHLPKSQAKINQYVESSQRKLTKLVMGYVDKYVNI
ncbi:hypothetical protein HPP92_007692 [Vanilla planifolia]|uniref:Uncharacterized protein n=1 Tax=Vanilla planifolia TaxID=51239 RepID=A0A835RKQ5_VANPL|nr:hypothetical protein HPP92_007692 [Vanilla planifolia]